MTETVFTPTKGPWYVNPNGGAWEICTDLAGTQVIGMAHEQPEAVLMASAPHMLDALIQVQEIAANMIEADERERILDALSEAFGKIFQEAS